MDFDEILAQILQLLQRDKRLSYRALKRRFALDDEYLEDVKAELIQAKQLARDEAGAVLVWVGEAATPTAPASTPARPGHLLTPQAVPPHEAAPFAAAPPPPDAERRQLTVLFCDLVDSTVLAGQLDPEDLREVVRAYQQLCAEVIQRFDGHIAQYLGDGLLVYFGYPQAHEDEAQRAMRSGLGIVEALGALNTRLERAHGVRLAVRLGIHTGLVVVGEIGSSGRQEQLALGETPNIAARLQGLAAPDTVVISAATAHLVHGYFVCQPLGAPAVKGLPRPLQLYRVLYESGAQTRLDVVPPRGLTPLIGRDEEVLLLQRRWDQVTTGMGQVVLLSGEAGIGKSRLVQVLKEHIAAVPHTRIEWRGSPYHRQSALYPVIDHLQRLLRGHHDASPAEPLRTLEAALTASGLAQVRQGVADFQATGAVINVPYYCTMLADITAHLGRSEDGLQALAEADTLVEQHDLRWWEAEIARLRGVLLLLQTGTPQAEAETWLQRALDVARRQEAKSLELRAAMSLARLWQQQGQRAAARDLLAPIYGWFTAGFDTTDLQEAKVLLEELGI